MFNTYSCAREHLSDTGRVLKTERIRLRVFSDHA